MATSNLLVRCIQPASNRSEGEYEVTRAADDALDAAMIAAITSALPKLVADAPQEGSKSVTLKVVADTGRLISETTETETEGRLTSEESGSTDQRWGQPRYISLDESIATSRSGEIGELVRTLQQQLEDKRRHVEELTEEKLGLLRRRHVEEEQRAEWIRTLQKRMEETLNAKDDLNSAKDLLMAQRQEQHMAAIKDMQKKVASALRQRDEALTDNVSNEEQLLREADRYKDEVDRLQDEIEEQVRSGDANIGDQLTALKTEQGRRIRNLQQELKNVKERSEKDERAFLSRKGELEARIKNIEIERGKLQAAVDNAVRDLRSAEKDRNAAQRELEYEQSGRKREKEDLVKAQQSLLQMRLEKENSERLAAERKAAADESSNLRHELMETSRRYKERENDLRNEKDKLYEELRETKSKVRELMADNERKVSHESYRQTQQEIDLLMLKLEDGRKRHEQHIKDVTKRHEEASKKIQQQLADSQKASNEGQAKIHQELLQTMMDRDTMRKALDDERNQIAELEDELSDLADKFEEYRNEGRMRMERERLDKLRQIARLKQSLNYMSRKFTVDTHSLQDAIKKLQRESEELAAEANLKHRELTSEISSLKTTKQNMADEIASGKQEIDWRDRQMAHDKAKLERQQIELDTVNQILREEREDKEMMRVTLRKEMLEMIFQVRQEEQAKTKAFMEAKDLEVKKMRDEFEETLLAHRQAC